MNGRTKLILLIVIIGVLGFSQAAHTCTCGGPIPPKLELKLKDAVFVGGVLSVDLDTIEFGRRIHRVQFLVDRYWKGVSDDTITVSTNTNEGSCGFPFEPDSTYLVYAYTIEDTSSDLHGQLFTSICTRTRLLSKASEDLSELGPPVVVSVGEDRPKAIPAIAELFQNYPNPFNPATQIHFELSSRNHVTLTIYNALGKKVKTLVDEIREAGSYSVTWDGTDKRGQPIPSGVYFYRFDAGIASGTKKMILMR
ncbi:T9SS type A sorting domain-containing protein [candidate division KSB1 bacterium]|nr:T9SS type A sorting domain-containing protein [candidate division KSB1 bacterium]NIR70517.1 T9SS type A sorting domain-containing protein [candidate division KSB1 bacterium]NIS24516.1 T9SS type A sorting domain-containing protein [candidate division KSB1 bacterium]NIT70111.1 T9SS type A sorting domain-containing protein [candidate division KSB1 bacterium]NIU23766.1 T9SS type A sorting domain-containing protein [candidate division KSB1 bacterium]